MSNDPNFTGAARSETVASKPTLKMVLTQFICEKE